MKVGAFVVCICSLAFIHADEPISHSLKASNVLHMQFKGNDVCDLSDVGKRYIDLLNTMGAVQNFTEEEDLASLCVPTCKKIVNGAVWFEGAQHFIPQLLSTREEVGSWHIKPVAIIPGNDEKTVVVHFICQTEKVGLWNAMVILRCNEKGLITEINEIFNNYEGKLE